MKKDFLKIMSCFVVLSCLLCGCSTNNKVGGNNQATETQEEKTERASEYTEKDKPWGEYNYKNLGVISGLDKNLDDNYVTADFTVDGGDTTDKVKIYGTDMDTSSYEGKKVFIAGVKDDDKDKDFVLVKYEKDVTLVDQSLLDGINSLSISSEEAAFNDVKDKIDAISNVEYKKYAADFYNGKINQLNEDIKQQNEKNNKDAEARAAQAKAEQERQQQQQQQEAAAKQAQIQAQQQAAAARNTAQPNGETVYVAASGNGECYHRDPNCSQMKGKVNSMSKAEAEQNNKRPCKKCYK